MPSKLKDHFTKGLEHLGKAASSGWNAAVVASVTKALGAPTIAALESLKDIAPAPLNGALYPFVVIITELIRAAENVQANKTEAWKLASRAAEISVKLEEVVRILPSNQVQVTPHPRP